MSQPQPAYSISPQVAIGMIRRTSCYPGIRFLVNVAAYLVVLISVGFAIALVVSAFKANTKSPQDLFFTLGAACACGAAAVLALLARDAILLLVDIADTLIASYARSSR